MIPRILVILCLCAGLCLAEPASRPGATRPTTRAMRFKPASRPSTMPTTFPTPAELMQRIQTMAQDREKLLKVAYFDLSKPIQEKPADFTLFGEQTSLTIRSLIQRMNKARDDKDIRAVLITLGGAQFNLAQAQEVRDCLIGLRKAGKLTFVYADGYDTTDYTLATGATDICLLEGGEMLMPGPSIETMFAKGLLDKIGVQADFIQIGEYKGADEQFTRTEPTPELRGELNKLLDALYGQIADGIAVNRNLDQDAVRQVIDQAILTGPAARQCKLVDHLVDIDHLRELIADQLGGEIDLIHNYAAPQKETADFSNPFALLSLLTRKPETSDKPAIAVIHAQGVIVDGDGGDSLFGDGMVGSDEIRKAFRIAQRDEKIAAIVLRIDSPGGSALASEAMWQAVRRVAEDKPVIVSIGSMAASGGYYLASAGQYIYADPSAIVGSIGVVGGKMVLKDLYTKLGLTTESFSRGKNAALFSSTQSFDERQRRMLTNWMRQTYDQFTQRVMTTRGGKIKDIDQVARGRIFLAHQAKDLGMVDELGGIDQAIQFAATQAKLLPGDYDVQVLPTPKTLGELLTGSDDPDAAMPLHPRMSLAEDSILRTLAPHARRAMLQQVQILQLMQDHPVMLVMPYSLTVR